jgi:hypothetical protein
MKLQLLMTNLSENVAARAWQVEILRLNLKLLRCDDVAVDVEWKLLSQYALMQKFEKPLLLRAEQHCLRCC